MPNVPGRFARKASRPIHITFLSLLALINIIFPQPAMAHVSGPAISALPDASCITVDEALLTTPQTSGHLPDVPARPAKRTLWLTLTAYSSTVDQTDGDPFTTASGSHVRDGIIAYNLLPFGTQVRFPDVYGDKIFVVEDRMNARYGGSIADIWMHTREEAKQWGARIVKMEIL
ncbi:MAG: 3D domain-containing protein [Candidatus Nomurabacteria bacterium]|nr:MAG: 3D domain-containing protein [Candidatus Nomurabacteria bacterium]